jgi:hypothetical protein
MSCFFCKKEHKDAETNKILAEKPGQILSKFRDTIFEHY